MTQCLCLLYVLQCWGHDQHVATETVSVLPALCGPKTAPELHKICFSWEKWVSITYISPSSVGIGLELCIFSFNYCYCYNVPVISLRTFCWAQIHSFVFSFVSLLFSPLFLLEYIFFQSLCFMLRSELCAVRSRPCCLALLMWQL